MTSEIKISLVKPNINRYRKRADRSQWKLKSSERKNNELKFKKISYLFYSSRNLLTINQEMKVKNGFIFLFDENIKVFYETLKIHNYKIHIEKLALCKMIISAISYSQKKNCMVQISVIPDKNISYSGSLHLNINLVILSENQKSIYGKELILLNNRLQYTNDVTSHLYENLSSRFRFLYPKQHLMIQNTGQNIYYSNNVVLIYLMNNDLYIVRNNTERPTILFKFLIDRLEKLKNKSEDIMTVPFKNIVVVDKVSDECHNSALLSLDASFSINIINKINHSVIETDQYSKIILLLISLINDELMPKLSSSKYFPIPYGIKISQK
uniref:Uncharacterized protein n=1 Tax=Bigelowiella natans TaxID=227086 RepID=A0A6T9YL06_BIGNA|mmetsp:Transcript_2021/g.3052  ORF Transcript_2021/g.3052 Transcript_2021/m.3052 type:complete len:325 (+) Transcript_2021:1737-2711(+)